MSQWYVKELAKLAGVTVQALHYYDKNDVLKPSVRLANGYRMYSQADLIKLQQIVALKFFGFGLEEIKNLLAGDVDVQQQLAEQVAFLEQRARAMLDAAKNLKKIVATYDGTKSTSWKSVIQMIEVYHMVQKFEKTWLGKVLTKDQLEFVVKKFGDVPEVEQQAYSKAWDDLVAEVTKTVDQDPSGPVAQAYAKRWMDLVNKYFSDRGLGEAIWNAYKNGNVPESEADRAGYPYIPQHVAEWIDTAVKVMFKNEMIQRFEKSWLGSVLTSEQLKKLMAAFGRLPEADRRVYSQKWDALIKEVSLHLHEDPCGPVGQKYLKQWHELEYQYVLDLDIQDAIWDAYKRGVVPKNPEERLGYPDISLEMIVWLEKAAHITCSCKNK